MIDGYLEALHYFDESDFMKLIGFDSRGIDTLVIFGNRYEKVKGKDKQNF